METQYKYTLDGNAVEVIEELKSGFLVQRVYEEEDECFAGGEAYVVDRVFNSAPTEKLDKNIAELEQYIRNLTDARLTLQADVRQMESDKREKLQRYAKYQQLVHLDKFLDGKITHYVEHAPWDAPKIVPFDGTKSEFDRDTFRLLGLFGKANGNLEWALNKYSDGSGTWYTVTPCTSYEEAVEVARELIQQRAELTPGIIEAATKYGIEIPEEKMEAYRAKRIENLQTRLAETKASEQKLIAELENYSNTTQIPA